MITLIITLFSLLIGLWILISAVGSGPVLAMQRVALSPCSEMETAGLLNQVISSGEIDAQWLSSVGFQPVDAYRVERMSGVAGIVVWKLEDQQTYVCAYLLVNAQVIFDIVTMLESGMFTTGKSKDSQLLPYAPGSYMQSFTATIPVLYRRHREGLQTLERLKKLVPVAGDQSFEEYFSEAMLEQSAYIRSLSFWPFRIPWWYFTRRSGRHEKTIAELEKVNF